MTGPIGPASQYASAKPFFDKAKPSTGNLANSPDDQARLQAYALYEDMYHNRPETFKVFIRGEDADSGIYFPSAKKIVEAMNRFFCKDFNFIVPPGADEANADAENTLVMHMSNLFRREKMLSKFANQKRNGLIRGDVCWYLKADPNKPAGSRISILELNPSNYFPIPDPADKTRVIGCHIVDIIRDPREKDDKSKEIVRRQTYLKTGVSYDAATGQYVEVVAAGATQGVWYETTHWTIGKWDDRNMKKDDMEQATGNGIVDIAMTQLPAQITSLPVYHWKNGPSETLFGMSELAGIETLVAAINQSMTDEDLTLVLQGLGVYATDSKAPTDATGKPTAWTLGPGVVVEHTMGTNFQRISGVSSVAPFQEHITAMQNAMQEGNGIPDIAAGKVDVTVAESGVSLALQLAPILASGKEKEGEALSVTDHMLYDLITMWFPAYESLSFEGASVSSTVGDPMPVNREARIQEVMLLFTSSLITIAMAQAELAKLGYNFQAGDDIRVLKEAAALAAAQSGDENANRYAQELEPRTRELNDGAGEEVGGLIGAGVEPSAGEPPVTA